MKSLQDGNFYIYFSIFSLTILRKLSGKVILIALMANLTVGMASEFDLITESEYSKMLSMGISSKKYKLIKKSFGSPVIRIEAPVETIGTLSSPFDIIVNFEAQGDAEIIMDSLKIYYVMFINKDITRRILDNAVIKENSIFAYDAKLPPGNHSFLIEIEDTLNRKSQKKIEISVQL